MATVHSLSLCARLTMDLHNLNSEGTEGNQQQTRMVHIIDQRGQRAVVNAVSGDMFKHILVEHLTPLLGEALQPMSAGARAYDPDRINTDPGFVSYCETDQEFNADGRTERRRARESEIMTKMLRDCSVTDIAGTLVTRGRAVGRKSVAEFGWVVGLPTDGAGEALTTTEQYFHVKYAPEGRGVATGGETVAGRQAIFHRPASSGVYAVICNLDLYRIGLNDITREYVLSMDDRQKRAKALIQALAATLLKPTGAQRNTQNPHLVACEGVVSIASTSLPAPTVSPLHDGYQNEVRDVANVLNSMRENAVTVNPFKTFSEGARLLADISNNLQLTGG